MPRLVEFHPEALAEAEAAALWYAQRSEPASIAFAREIDRAVGLIAESPERWPTHASGTRRYLLRRFPFHVVYRVEASRILVVAIAHGSRRPGYWTGRAGS